MRCHNLGSNKLERARDLFRHALREVGFEFRVLL